MGRKGEDVQDAQRISRQSTHQVPSQQREVLQACQPQHQWAPHWHASTKQALRRPVHVVMADPTANILTGRVVWQLQYAEQPLSANLELEAAAGISPLAPPNGPK